MTHEDLFSGIGGFALAAQWCWGRDHKLLSFVEKDAYCREVLSKHWPNVEITEEIHDYKGRSAELITGGFPCQPFSCAGKRRGALDDRYLWPEMLRVIRESQPTWVIGENVTGIISLALDTVLADLELLNYACRAFVIPACAVGAPTYSYRVWILGTPDSNRLERVIDEVCNQCRTRWLYPDITTVVEQIQRGSRDRLPASWIVRKGARLPGRVDRTRALGNAIVPQVAYEIFKAIRQSERF